MRNRRMLLIAATAIAVVAVLCFFHLKRTGKADPETPNQPKQEHGKAIRQQLPPKGRQANRAKPPSPDMDAFSSLPPAERRLAESVQTALDNEDYAATIKAASKALSSTNASVRLQAVEALGWFGKRALAELTPCMADPDEEVAQAAVNAWELGLSEMEESRDRFDVALMALTTISEKNALRTIGSQFASAASDLIEGIDDEKAAFDKRVEVIQSVAEMICGNHEGRSAAAREIYEEIPGHEWINVEEAEKYLADPENYEPPEGDNSESTEDSRQGATEKETP